MGREIPRTWCGPCRLEIIGFMPRVQPTVEMPWPQEQVVARLLTLGVDRQDADAVATVAATPSEVAWREPAELWESPCGTGR